MGTRKPSNANVLQRNYKSLCRCKLDYFHPTRAEKLFVKTHLYRFRLVRFQGMPFYAVGRRFAHYKLKPRSEMFKHVPPIMDLWVYLEPAEFSEAFDTFEVSQLGELRTYRTLQMSDPYDYLYLNHSIVTLPDEEYGLTVD